MAQEPAAESSDKWSSFFSRLNPVPRFPEYTGPHKVGTVDIEIPVCELESPAPAPDSAADILTVQFRIFYPCEPTATGKRIAWLPSPQRDHLSAYIKFLGVGPLLAQAASYIPRHLHFTTIPVINNAPILEPQTPNGRWPTMIFSHGLGGSRNAYSQIAGSMASHGVVVICPEHRDGSAIASFIRIPTAQGRFFARSTRRMVPFLRIPHNASDEVHERRNDQLRIRLWELGLIHEAILHIDEGQKLTNLDKNAAPLSQFAGQLRVQEPGSIIFSGHSFGAATMVQFLKCVFYAGRPELEAMETSLYTPNWESSICTQVTPQNVTILLDMWCFPLLSHTTKPLFNLPLPAYDHSNPSSSAPQSPGGSAILAIESEDFFKWRDHLHTTARILSPDPSALVVAPLADNTVTPHLYYVKRSVHLSQSDFALLFPWLTRKVFKSESPLRALRLNLRALLQILRVNGFPVEGTQQVDLVDDATVSLSSRASKTSTPTPGSRGGSRGGEKVETISRVDTFSSRVDTSSLRYQTAEPCTDDVAILEREGNAIRENKNKKEKKKEPTFDPDELVRAWRWINIVGMGDSSVDEQQDENETKKAKRSRKGKKENAEAKTEEDPVIQATDEEEPVMAGLIEPSAPTLDDRRPEPALVGAFAVSTTDDASSSGRKSEGDKEEEEE